MKKNIDEDLIKENEELKRDLRIVNSSNQILKDVNLKHRMAKESRLHKKLELLLCHDISEDYNGKFPMALVEDLNNYSELLHGASSLKDILNKKKSLVLVERLKDKIPKKIYNKLMFSLKYDQNIMTYVSKKIEKINYIHVCMVMPFVHFTTMGKDYIGWSALWSIIFLVVYFFNYIIHRWRILYSLKRKNKLILQGKLWRLFFMLDRDKTKYISLKE